MPKHLQIPWMMILLFFTCLTGIRCSNEDPPTARVAYYWADVHVSRPQEILDINDTLWFSINQPHKRFFDSLTRSERSIDSLEYKMELAVLKLDNPSQPLTSPSIDLASTANLENFNVLNGRIMAIHKKVDCGSAGIQTRIGIVTCLLYTSPSPRD